MSCRLPRIDRHGAGREACKLARVFEEIQTMQIKTNVRAGASKQKQKRGSSTDSSSTEVEVVVPVTARCPGV